MRKNENMKFIQLGKVTGVAYDNRLQAFEECKQQEKRGNFFGCSREKAKREDRIEEMRERC